MRGTKAVDDRDFSVMDVSMRMKTMSVLQEDAALDQKMYWIIRICG